MTYECMQSKQLRLSLLLAGVFLLTVFSVPFLNSAMPERMLTPVMGIPFVWLLVGVFFHVEFWTIAVIYTTYSNRWESQVIRDGS